MTWRGTKVVDLKDILYSNFGFVKMSCAHGADLVNASNMVTNLSLTSRNQKLSENKRGHKATNYVNKLGARRWDHGPDTENLIGNQE